MEQRKAIKSIRLLPKKCSRIKYDLIPVTVEINQLINGCRFRFCTNKRSFRDKQISLYIQLILQNTTFIEFVPVLMKYYSGSVLVFLGILVLAECGVVNVICKVKEDDVFRGAEDILADYVQFRLYTRFNKEDFVLLRDAEDIRNSDYNSYFETIFIVHGYQSFPDSPRLILLKEFLLMRHNYNVILVDWSLGARGEYIPSAIRNAFASAGNVASFIKLLQATSGTVLRSVHFIGFSLGAQLSSFVGKRLHKIGRISALDPAGPCFSSYGTDHRIHYTDAEFVDVIITNGDGAGMKEPSGHVNFMVQGGVTQSECGAKVLEEYYATFDAKSLFLDYCSHQRALQLYIESLKGGPCPLVGYSCPTYTDFLEGECTDCGEDEKKCAPLGYDAIKYKPKIANETRVFYLKAAPEPPYCLHHYSVVIKLVAYKHNPEHIGELFIRLRGHRGETEKQLTSFAQSFQNGEEYKFLLTLPSEIGHLKSVSLLWIRTSKIMVTQPGTPVIVVTSVTVSLMNGSNNMRTQVFGSCRRRLQSGSWHLFKNENVTSGVDWCLD